ncbi:hypothetical protein OAF65_10775 [Verrucomicrobiales bacterium]|nr:hypothetical protein [Verrucomicrobiales bacterium]
MREEHEILILNSPMPFNAEVSLEGYISVMEAEDILPKQYVLYINTSEGQELQKYVLSSFSEAIRKAYQSFGDFVIGAYDKFDE